MKAITTFDENIGRARSFIELHKSLSKTQRKKMKDPDDLLRSSIAFAVAGMDTYFTDRFSESLVRFLKKRRVPDGLIKFLSEAGLDTKAALEMLAMDRPYRRIRTLVENHLSNFTTQKQQIIDDLFVVYGVKNLSKNAQGLAGQTTLLRTVESAVLRRHAIVHGGDLNARDKRNDLTERTASRYINAINQYVQNCENLLVKSLKI